MDNELRAIATHVLGYAMLQRASSVITEQQFRGIEKTVETATEDTMLNVLNFIMHALNENYEYKLKAWLDSNSIIVRP